MQTLIIGCGYVGAKLAKRLSDDGQRVHCLTASASSMQRLKAQKLSAAILDLDASDSDIDAHNVDVAFYFVPPPSTGRTDPRSRRACEHLRFDKLTRLVLISTTGVYGDCQGRWIDENAILKPKADRSYRRVHAEQTWQTWANQHNIELTILRVAGIYADDRLPIKRLRAHTPVLARQQAPWSNRIHATDLVAVCTAAAYSKNYGIYNVADDHPSTMSDYFLHVANALKLPRPQEITYAQACRQFSPRMMEYLGESRRIDNSKLKRELGVVLRYPSLSVHPL